MAKLVAGTGPKDADIAIVGEAPGKKEAQQGKPFIGKSGKLLTRLLKQAGILRQHCYITNVIKERPPGNNISKFIKPKKGWVSDAGASYIRNLKHELLQVDPNVIIGTGNVPLWVFSKNTGITKWRGSILDSQLGKFIPTIHPAAALRGMYIWRYYIIFDLMRAARESESPDLDRTERSYILEPTYEECTTYLQSCREQDMIAFDIEVTKTAGENNGEVSCISFSYSKHHAISIPFLSSKGGNYFSLEQEKALWVRIGEVLEDPSISTIAHNATFDTTFLYRKYGIKTRGIEDTMVAQGLLYPDFDKDLGFVTTQYTDIPYYKDEGKSDFKSQNNRDFWRYNAKDSVVLEEAFQKQREDLKKLGNWETYKWQRKLIEPLLAITEHGMNLDLEGMRSHSDKLFQRITRLEDELCQVTGRPLNPNSPKQLMEYFYGDGPGDKGIKPYKSRSTGNPTTNEKALKRLAGGTRGDEESQEAAKLLLEIRGLSKLKGTYLDADIDPDGRLRSSLNPIGTTTGRLSSSKTIFGTGMNIQNLPYEMRQYILPDPGYTMYEVDLGQAENRVVGYAGPDDRMIEAFESGTDIHSKTAALLFDMNTAEVRELYEEWEEEGKPPGPNKYCPDIGQGHKSYRDWGKQANHAFNYDMKYRKAALNWEIPQKEAKWIYEQYHKAYPGVKRMHDWIDDELNENRIVTNLLGRKRKFFGRWRDIKKNAYSHLAQSTVADIINRYGVCGVYYDQDRFGDVTLLSQVHDSIWFQIPLNLGWDTHAHILDDICDVMEPTLSIHGREFQIPAEVTILPNNAKEGHEFDGRPSAIELRATWEEMTDKSKAVA